MAQTISVMTYNVHSCIGMDGKVSPLRVAEAIEEIRPDIVALQELDAGLRRSEMIDQAHLIASTLEMFYHFHSSIRVEAGGYGNAVLSRYPLRLVRAGALPAEPFHPDFERRGVIWTEIEAEGRKLQVLATHFGLSRRERTSQAESITGPEWLGHPECRFPVILCGDFNTLRGAPAYRRIAGTLRDVQRPPGSRQWARPTWPVRFPFLRIDHIFASPELTVRDFRVPQTPLTRIASDHLPLVATLELP